MAALKATGGNVKPDVLLKALKAVSVDTVRGHLIFPAGSGPFGTVANLPYTMGKIGPNMEVQQMFPTLDVRVSFKNGNFTPYVAK